MSDLQLSLKQQLVKDLNPKFVEALIERTKEIYPKSFDAVDEDPNLADEQARYVLGYLRRGYAETVLLRTAVEFGMKPKLVQPEGGGCKHVYVSSGMFGLVMCHVPSPDAFPKHSSTREQSSQVNEFISQLTLLPEAIAPEPEEFYGIIIHSECLGQKKLFGSIKIGFPNTDFEGWEEEPICLQEICQIQQKLIGPTYDLQAQIQNPQPKWKPQEVKVDKEG